MAGTPMEIVTKIPVIFLHMVEQWCEDRLGGVKLARNAIYGDIEP